MSNGNSNYAKETWIDPKTRWRAPSAFDFMGRAIGRYIMSDPESTRGGYGLIGGSSEVVEDQLIAALFNIGIPEGVNPEDLPLTQISDNELEITDTSLKDLMNIRYTQALFNQNYRINPDTGEPMLYSRDTGDFLGDVYFDAEGNYSDYWNIGLDPGEDYSTKNNIYRTIGAFFSDPKYVVGKANPVNFTVRGARGTEASVEGSEIYGGLDKFVALPDDIDSEILSNAYDRIDLTKKRLDQFNIAQDEGTIEKYFINTSGDVGPQVPPLNVHKMETDIRDQELLDAWGSGIIGTPAVEPFNIGKF